MKDMLFTDYFEEWVFTYKKDSVKEITLKKYHNALSFIKKQFGKITINEMTRREYQQILNEYAETHERQTTMDFHHILKGALQDAFHDGIIKRDPTYKAIVKGKEPTIKKKDKFLSDKELNTLISNLNITNEANSDLLVLLLAKTGLRFGELLGLTPNDFDFNKGIIDVNKTWDYKSKNGSFQPTKNKSSVRKIIADKKIMDSIKDCIDNEETENYKSIFIKDGVRIFNSTINTFLKNKCIESDVPIISLHGLRHTHASILLNVGVSIQTIAERLGHADTTTTQQTYLHIIKELEEKDNKKMLEKLELL